MRIGILILSLSAIISCHTPIQSIEDFHNDRIMDVPNSIIAKMDSFIISKTGTEVFSKYFVFDTKASGYFSGDSNYYKFHKEQSQQYVNYPHIKIVYHFQIPDKPWRNVSLSWPVDTSGNFIKYNLPFGIPDCTKNPKNCSFKIDSLQAISIANAAGLPKGLKQITARFTKNMFPDRERQNIGSIFCWAVSSTIEEGGYGATWVDYYVDISTGKIVVKSEGGWVE
jgi:hypothetical protein